MPNTSHHHHHDDDVVHPYNIIPLHTPTTDHPSLRFPEVLAVVAALRSVGDLRLPPQWHPDMDLLDWLGLFFGFQNDNVRNQRENLLLHLANAQMRLSPPQETLDATLLRSFRSKLLRNYTSWCSYLAVKPAVNISYRSANNSSPNHRRELLYVSLYLLIWGEAANLRFLPECLSYIFHHMAMDLNKLLQTHDDDNNFHQASLHQESFLDHVVQPIYRTLLSEVESSRNGTEPHCKWRNYDDINEFFWDKRCFEKLKWPIDIGSGFFDKRVRKTGFVERRSFWNLFRSFHRLWVMLFLFFQAALIVAWEDKTYPWHALRDRDLQVRVLTIFFTWSALMFLQSLLDIVMQWRLVSAEKIGLGMKMVLKAVVAAAWFIVFFIFYQKIWEQRNRDGNWSVEANKRLVKFLEVVFVFMVPELLALILLVLPWVRNFIEKKDWRVFFMLLWWFQSRTFVGRGLSEGLTDNIGYTLFWVVVLASKFCFSYFLQIRPMVGPSKMILDLKDINYLWHELFQNGTWFALGLLWLPVILVYLMDIQIWYSIYSSLVGASVGLFAHLGEIRSMQQLKLRFQFFASAVLFNLMPEDQSLNASRTLSNKFKDVIHRMKLRYGFGRFYMKLESNQSEANKFALLWNEVIMCFREEDIISDREVELLELPKNSWNVRVIPWPCFLLCNELLLALSQAKELVDVPDKRLWSKICKHEFRRCAVIETYDCIKHLLLQIIKPNSEEHSIVMVLFQEIDHSLEIGKFTKVFKTTALLQLHVKLIKFLELLNKKQIESSQMVKTLQALYEIVVRDFFKERRNIERLREDGLAPQNPDSSSKVLLFENAIQLPETVNENFYRQIRRLLTILTSRDSMENVPVNLEARRRITFFTNSLFMKMPHAPRVEKMMAFSVLTPYYSEEVVYSKEQLRVGNEDGISTLYYLQTIYDDEWKNFMERMRREGMKNESDIWTDKLGDLRSWASYRGQTLSRTVRGMMYYYKGLKLLAFLDSASQVEIQEGTRELVSLNQDNLDGSSPNKSLPSPMSLSRKNSSSRLSFKGRDCGTALMKFTYVISCQIYGAQKERKDPRAEEILYLMKNNEALRVAYVDEVPFGSDEKEYYSVLAKYDRELEKEVEIYRVKLPGPINLGEGKPENQNHAIIFTRGDAVQTIDMNQDNYFEEALKIRNLLEEYRYYYGIRKPTILGVREHIFTASVSSLAWFMSAQEMSFVTLGQRVLANPLKVRMHYGHPDVFDRFWFITRGGISKASRVINISEDIFAGFNCTLRGGNVTHHEYIQVGKGRDVGLNQVSIFEAKVASGNGEQVLSRDVYRLGRKLDFFRMLSFFYTTVGFFFNTMMIVLTVYAFLWGRLMLALSGIEAAMVKNNNKALGIVLSQQFIVQIGLFTALPMIVENSLEEGFLQSVWDFLTMQLQLSSVFYTFSMGTRSHFFGRTILHGGAKYRATGRGFVVEHKSFAENYRLYARSHFVKAIELGLILIVYATHSTVATDTFVYIAMTFLSWFLVASWIMTPFLFNPSGFDWLKTVRDFDEFMNWIWQRQSFFAKAEKSWERWWYEEQDHLRLTGIWGKLFEIILDLRFLIFQYGIVYRLDIAAGSTSIGVYFVSWIYVFFVFGIYVVVAYSRNEYEAKRHLHFRLVQSMVIVLAIVVILALMKFTKFEFMDIFTSLVAFIPTGWGMILIAQVFRPFLQRSIVWNVVVSLARLYDTLFGMIVMVPVALLSWLPGFQPMQTRILFNEAFGRGLRISQIVTVKKSSAKSV